MSDLIIPEFLLTQIREGKAIPLLGSGASLGAATASGVQPLTSLELAARLPRRFLGSKYSTYPLAQIGEYAISESSLREVQEFIAQQFEGMEPSAAHRMLATIRWWGIATTNYDRFIERAYETTPRPAQTVHPIVDDRDHIEDNLRDRSGVVLLKLHGCVTRTDNPSCPLVLTTDQYIDHRGGREQLFKTLEEWATERPIVYIGHSLQDPDLRAILNRLSVQLLNRPRHYLVTKQIQPEEVRFWEAKRITPVEATFERFMEVLDQKIDSPFRQIVIQMPTERPEVARHFRDPRAEISGGTQSFLDVDVRYVRGIIKNEAVAPTEFYKGVDPGFAAIDQDLDVRRRLADTLLAEHILSEASHPKSPEVILIKAHAGAGKTILLKRIAWDAARDYDKFCLFATARGSLNIAALQELLNLSKDELFLFVDNAADRIREILSVLRSIGPEGARLTLILGERLNEWNMFAGPLADYVTDEYEIGYLSAKEIDQLVQLLEKHKALGYLEKIAPEERRNYLAERAGRQLLVALHEATLGKPFEEIIEDEFRNIFPQEARNLYLTICVLNRLGVPVRAGLISRTHNIPFSEFQARFFAPLEHVVRVFDDPVSRDHLYSARHPYIAEMVFRQILRTVDERYDHYVRFISGLNTEYSTDRRAFRRMLQGRAVLELFPNPELANRIYDAAIGNLGPDAYIFHQWGIYEMNRYGGSLEEAGRLFRLAFDLEPRNSTIKHSMAEHRIKLSENARTPLEREHLLDDAAKLAREVKYERTEDAFGIHTLTKIGVRRLREILKTVEEPGSGAAIEKAVKDVEASLTQGLLEFPGDPYLLTAEAELADLLSDSQRAVEALRKAFAANPRSSFIASRLAKVYVSRDPKEALRILKEALDANDRDQRLHYEYAKLVMSSGDQDGRVILHHLQRSFVLGDGNYDAHLLYGRQLFIDGNRDGWWKVFEHLRSARVHGEVRYKLLYPLAQESHGVIAQIEAVYCWLARDGPGDRIYAHKNAFHETHFADISVGRRIRFKIAFNMKGPSALYVVDE